MKDYKGILYSPNQVVTYKNIGYFGSAPTLSYNCIMGGWDGPGEGNVIIYVSALVCV